MAIVEQLTAHPPGFDVRDGLLAGGCWRRWCTLLGRNERGFGGNVGYVDFGEGVWIFEA